MARKNLHCLRGEQLLLSEVAHANSFFTRLRGLLGQKELKQEQGLLITPCHSVHTLGMHFAIGVVFLNRDGQVLHQISAMAPGKLSPVIKGAKQVLELHPETLATWGLETGDVLVFR
ncbi:MAG: DUF192 domain-containing protein [Candidatus Sericytochromatia bacterium]